MKLKNKRIQASLSLATGIILVFSIVIANVFHLEKTAMGVEANQGSKTTAQQKIVAQSLYKCIASAMKPSLSQKAVSKIKTNTKSLFDNGISIGSPWLQYQIIGEHKGTGGVSCHDEKGKIAQDGFLMTWLKFSQAELMCNGQLAGIYVSNDANAAGCQDIYDGKSDEKLKVAVTSSSGGKLNYFRALVEQKTFGNNVPAGSMFKYTDLEKYYIYHDAFTNICATTKASSGGDSLSYQIKEWDEGTEGFKKQGWIQNKEPNKYVSVFNAYNSEGVIEDMSCGDLMDTLNGDKNPEIFNAYKTAKENETPDAPVDDPDKPTKEETSGGEYAKSCTNMAGPLSWLLCTLAQALADGVDGLYDKLENKMQLKAELFSAESAPGKEEPGILKGWRQFLNIANGAFIIILLIVIFSQLTGIGLDNYGIKKILPRLIVGLVLVQASFILSQLAIDLSNVIGSSVSDFFKGIADNIVDVETSSKLNFAGLLTGAVGMAATGTSVAIAGISIAGAVAAGASIMPLLLPLIFSALSALVSVLLFFIMLGLRQILAIACVVLAPIAFLFNILPNTQKVFKTWTSALKAVLVFYPICGLLYGVGILTKALLVSQGGEIDFWMALVGLLAPFTFFFLAPSLLSKSISAIGALGGKLQGMGRSMRGGLGKASGRYKKGDAYLDAQRRSANQLSKWKLEGITGKGGLDKKIADLQGKDDLSRREQRKLNVYRTKSSHASAAMKKFAEEEAKATTMSEPTTRANALAQIEADAESEKTEIALNSLKLNGIDDGTGKGGKTLYSPKALKERTEKLNKIGKMRDYTQEESRELKALARGIVAEPGGAKELAEITRGAGENFAFAMGDIVTNDKTVRDKVGEVDKKLSVYTEQFALGGEQFGARAKAKNGGAAYKFVDYETASLDRLRDVFTDETGQYDDQTREKAYNQYMSNEIVKEAYRRSPADGQILGQKGSAFKESLEDFLYRDQYRGEKNFQRVQDDAEVIKMVKDKGSDDFEKLQSYSRKVGVTGPSAKDVNVVSGPTP